MRTTCCRAVWALPAVTRTLTTVWAPGSAISAAVSTPRSRSARRSSSPAASSPTKPAAATRAPIAARFSAAFAAPPGCTSRCSQSSTSTGASRETRELLQRQYSSSTKSPHTSARCSRRRSTQWSSRAGSGGGGTLSPALTRAPSRSFAHSQLARRAARPGIDAQELLQRLDALGRVLLHHAPHDLRHLAERDRALQERRDRDFVGGVERPRRGA